MAQVKFHKATTLPGTPENSAIYFIPGTTAGVVEMYVTSTTGGLRQVAPFGSASPSAIAALGSTGVSEFYSRSDHTHALSVIPSTATGTTAAVDTNNTSIATTAFVIGQAATSTSPLITGSTNVVGTSTRFSRQDHQHIMPTNFVLPNGVTATTQTAGDNTTKVATTAFVTSALSSSSLQWTTEAW